MALICLDVGNCGLAIAAINFGIERDLLTFAKAVEARPLQRRDVYEHVLATVVRLDKAVTFGRVEELYDSCLH